MRVQTYDGDLTGCGPCTHCGQPKADHSVPARMCPREPTDRRFGALLAEIAQLHAAKAHDYGDAHGDNLRAASELGVSPYIGVLLRMNDKMTRLKAIARKGTRAVDDESVRDTLRDLAVYSLLAIILLEEKRDA